MDQMSIPMPAAIINMVSRQGYQKVSAVWNFEEERKSLLRRVEIIEALLRDAGNAADKRESRQVWLKNAKPLVYKAQDLVDRIETYLWELKSGKRNKFVKAYKKVKFRVRMAGKIERAHSLLDRIYREANEAGLLSFSLVTNTPTVDHVAGGEEDADQRSTSLLDKIRRWILSLWKSFKEVASGLLSFFRELFD